MTSRFRSKTPIAAACMAAFLWIDAFKTAGPCAAAAAYYVDSEYGDDSGDGLSPESAWRSVARVNAASFEPGDSVRFRRGGYWRETLTVPSGGAPGAPVTFGSYGSGPRPVIGGGEFVNGWAPAEALHRSPELVVNGSFGTNALFSFRGGVSIVSGAAVFDPPSRTPASLGQHVNGLREGAEYYLAYEITETSAYDGALYLTDGGAFGGRPLSAEPGWHSYRLACADANDPLEFACPPGQRVVMGNVSLRAAPQPGPGRSVYAAPRENHPFVMKAGGELLRLVDGPPENLAAGEWCWSGGMIWINTGGDPNQQAVEAATRRLCVYAGGKDHLVFESLRLEMARFRCMHTVSSDFVTLRDSWIGHTRLQCVWNLGGDGFSAMRNSVIGGAGDVHYAAGGLIMEGDAELVQNEVAYCDIGIQLGRGGGSHTGVIRENYVHHIGRTFGDIAGVDGQGIELTGSPGNIVGSVEIVHNLIHHCTGGGIALYLAENNLIRRNIVSFTGTVKGDRLWFDRGVWGYEGALSAWRRSTANQWTHNLLVHNAVGIQGEADSSENMVYDNLFAHSSKYGMQFGRNIVMHGRNLYTGNERDNRGPLGQGDLTGDSPGFAGAADGLLRNVLSFANPPEYPSLLTLADPAGWEMYLETLAARFREPIPPDSETGNVVNPQIPDPSPAAEITATPDPSPTPHPSQAPMPTPTAVHSFTPVPPSPTNVPTNTFTPTPVPTFTPTETPSPTHTPTPTYTPTPSPVPVDVPPNAVIVTDHRGATDDLSAGSDYDRETDRELVVHWRWEGADVRDVHVYVRTGGDGPPAYLGRTGSGDMNHLVWREGAPNLNPRFGRGPEFGEMYAFKVFGIRPDQSPRVAGPITNRAPLAFLEGNDPAVAVPTPTPPLPAGAVAVTDGMDAHADLSGAVDRDARTERALAVRWHLPMNPSPIDFHVYVRVNGKPPEYLGRAGGGTNAFEWRAGNPLLNPVFAIGPLYGNRYQFRVYPQTQANPPRFEGPFDSGGEVTYLAE